MAGLTGSMEHLVQQLRRLPGVGPRTAERYVFFLLTQPISAVRELSEAILRAKQTIGFCRTCFNLADGDLCAVCKDPARDPSLICVVEDHRAIRAMEKAGGYRGTYHVLLGALSPLDGITPKDLKIHELKERVKRGGVREVILATDSDLEGETTAMFLTKELRAPGLPTVATGGPERAPRVTRLAFGLPMGSSVEYADQLTLGRAMEGRRPL